MSADKYNTELYVTVPDWVKEFIDAGILMYGGESLVKTPPLLAGVRRLTVSLFSSVFVERVEKKAKSEGWIPDSYRRWSESDPGSISFSRVEDKDLWDTWRNRR